jgi:decaprenylphospho-beta-D-erythro-pentofuranosid-2-ulose 2-reductase
VIDALGAPSSVLVLGGSSEIGEAIVSRLARPGRLQRVVLAARPSSRRAEVAQRIQALGVAQVDVVDFEAAATDTHQRLVEGAFADGDVDVVVVAAGVLPDQQKALADPAIAVETAMSTYVGPASAMLHAANALSAQGHGVLVVLSSVAAERPRVANFVYGSAKAGLDAAATGLGDALQDSGVSVLVVRPGFVTTRMTEGLRTAPLSTTAAVVAESVAANLTRGTRTVWVPGALRYVMAVLRHLPRAVFRRLPG